MKIYIARQENKHLDHRANQLRVLTLGTMARLKLYVGHIQRFSSEEIYHAGKSGKKEKDNDSEEDGWIQLQRQRAHYIGQWEGPVGDR